MTPKEALKLLDCQRNCRECGSYDRELYRCNEPTPYAVDCVSEALEELEQVKKENKTLKIKAKAWDIVKHNIEIRSVGCGSVVGFTHCTLDIGFINYGKLQEAKALEAKE